MPATTDRRRIPGSQVGELLRGWRSARGMSQLDLALHAGFSPRHISFIETGRTHPSRQALVTLADALQVPLRERNHLLEAGGFAHVYRQTPLASDEMRQIRSVLQFILDRHAPYPAIVLDRYANCVMANDASRQLVAATVDASLFTASMNHLRIVFHPLGARRFIVNWEEVARHLLWRAERELGQTRDDGTAASLLAELRGYAGSLPQPRPVGAVSAGDLLLPVHIRKGDLELRLFSTIMTLGTPYDVTLQELRIESLFPADAASERTWRALTAAS